MFKICTACKFEWKTCSDFLSDNEIRLIGYQPHFENLKTGLILFNHRCKTTIGLPVEKFMGIYKGEIFTYSNKSGTSSCPEHCLHTFDIEPCPEKCECAYVRELLQIIRNWPKISPDH